nr:capsid assembly protein [uncultured Mediterranean phage uvMED]BAR25544.1 capsid assembly protein [uncultured Mediterranean phage uvMED]
METTFDIGNEVPESQKTAEAEALAQGEKIAEMEAADTAAKYKANEESNESAELIAGKFKSQDDLLKAYEELQSKLGKGEETEEPKEEEETEEETTEEVEEETVDLSEHESVISKASAQYEETGELNEESIEALSKMDSKDLISAYVSMFQKNQAEAANKQQVAVNESEVMDIVGGRDTYNSMVEWAGSNLSETEVAAYNNVTNSGNMDAIRFAVEALSTRYKNAEGSEKPLITGKSPAPKSKVYRSNAELARDIANPRYNSDPAFRMDVEAKLARSSNLL